MGARDVYVKKKLKMLNEMRGVRIEEKTSKRQILGPHPLVPVHFVYSVLAVVYAFGSSFFLSLVLYKPSPQSF